MLRKEMNSLPKTLDETYARILRSIPEEYQGFAVKLLRWLIFSQRPPNLAEMVDVFAIEDGSNPKFDPDARFPDPRDVLIVCPGLVISVEIPGNGTTVGHEQLRLAHFSVQEYLVSSRVGLDITIFEIDKIAANNTIATDCLRYLLHFHENNPNDYQDLIKCGGQQTRQHETSIDNKVARLYFSSQYPLLEYASWWWEYHTRYVDPGSSCINLALEILNNNSFYNNTLDNLNSISRGIKPYGSALCYVAEAGNMPLVKSLLSSVEKLPEDVVCGASEGGHLDILRELLASGANVNGRFQAGYTALWRASFAGHTTIAEELLTAGARIEAGDFISDTTPLQQASLWGNEETVRLLLTSGADPNTVGDEGSGISVWGKPLHLASKKGHWDVVKSLLEGGADFGFVCPEFDKWASETLMAAGVDLRDIGNLETEEEFGEQYETSEEKALARIVGAHEEDPKIRKILCQAQLGLDYLDESISGII